jgi:hypothetical protein
MQGSTPIKDYRLKNKLNLPSQSLERRNQNNSLSNLPHPRKLLPLLSSLFLRPRRNKSVNKRCLEWRSTIHNQRLWSSRRSLSKTLRKGPQRRNKYRKRKSWKKRRSNYRSFKRLIWRTIIAQRGRSLWTRDRFNHRLFRTRCRLWKSLVKINSRDRTYQEVED